MLFSHLSKRCGIGHLQAGHSSKLPQIESGNFTVMRQSGRGNLEIVGSDQITLACKFGPDSSMDSGFRHSEGLNEQDGEQGFHMPTTTLFSSRFLCSLNPMKQFRCGNRGNYRLDSGERTKESWHVELAPLVRDEQRGVENQSHADLRSGT